MDPNVSLSMPLPPAEVTAAAIPDAGQTWARLAFRRFRRNRLAVLGLALQLLILGVVFLGSNFVSRDRALRPQPLQRLQTPSVEHLLGTDEVGRDVLARLIMAGRVSLSISYFSMVVSVLLGTVVGVAAGYFGGWLDQVLMRITDAMLSLPAIFVLLMIAAIVRPSVPVIIIVLGFLNWMDLARIVRGDVLSQRRLNYIEAAVALGASHAGIVGRHILPGCFGSILVAAPLIVGRTLLSESALSFLGLGIQPPVPTWGNMLNQAQQFLLTAPGLAVSPGLMIVLTVVSFNMIGDGLRDAFDPKLTR